MLVTKNWETLPSTDLADRANWRSLGNDRYAVLRGQLLVVQSRDNKSRFGPVISEHNIAPQDTIEMRRRREQVISHSTTISDAIKFATTSRVCDQLLAKVSAELGAKVPGFSGKLSSEILSKSDYEITTVAENVLSTTTSHLIQETQEDEHIITMTGGKVPRVAELRRRYWSFSWDFYLHSYEYIELSYKKNWYWRDIRSTIKRAHSGVLGWPLVSVIFHDPQPTVDVCYEPVTNELEIPDGIEFRTLSQPMPASVVPEMEELEELAKFSFPVTREERSRAVRRTGVARKTAAKKSAPRKAARKAARKFAVKKTARKAAPRKSAARKMAAKKR